MIFLTAKGMTADRTQGYLAGVDDYIPKPFDPDELVARVRNVVRRQDRLLTGCRSPMPMWGRWPSRSGEIRSMLTGSAEAAASPETQLSFTPEAVSCSWWLRG